MNAIDFTSQMITKFAPKLKENDKDYIVDQKTKEKDQFFRDLSDFCNACEESNLQDVFNYVSRKHEYNTVPKIAMFWRFAEKNNLLKKKPVIHNPTWNICSNCGAKYSKVGRGCPKCRTMQAGIGTDETVPGDLIHVQEDCFYCTDIYPASVKDERKLAGPTCGDYGKKITPHCTRCMCNECCKQMIRYNNDPRGTTELYKSTELAQPWLSESEPLSKMAADMLEHMKKTRFREIS